MCKEIKLSSIISNDYGLGHWTLDMRHWTWDAGHGTLDLGRWTWDKGHWTLDKGRWTWDKGHWTLDYGYRRSLSVAEGPGIESCIKKSNHQAYFPTTMDIGHWTKDTGQKTKDIGSRMNDVARGFNLGN